MLFQPRKIFRTQIKIFLMKSESWLTHTLLVSCLPLLDTLINLGVLHLSSHGNNNQTHLN